MSPTIFGLVMLAALLHATWNAILKGGDNKPFTTVIVSASAGLIAIIILPLLPVPARQSWPFIGASSVLQVGYFVLLARTYRVADMSRTYPLMRGAAPLLVALCSAGLLHEPLAGMSWIGIAVISAGIFSMAAIRSQGAATRGIGLALVNALVIACYTLIDGAGVRLSDSPVAYTLWIYLLSCLPLVIWALHAQRPAFTAYLRRHWGIGLAGGAGSLASYSLALWAMTHAPIALVAALRETSILFGVAISLAVLKEHPGTRRIAAAGIIAVGAMLLRLA